MVEDKILEYAYDVFFKNKYVEELTRNIVHLRLSTTQ